MKVEKIWIVDSEPAYQDLYRETLGESYEIKIFDELQHMHKSLVNSADDEKPSLIVSELNFPNQNFLEFIEEKGASFANTPILIVSMSDDIKMIRECLTKKVDDIIFKPASRHELIVKIDHTLQKKSLSKQVNFDPINSTVTVKGIPTKALTKKELQILLILISSKKKSVSRSAIVEKVWKGIKVSRKSLDVHMCNLRKKIIDTGINIYSHKPNEYTIDINEGNGKTQLIPELIDRDIDLREVI